MSFNRFFGTLFAGFTLICLLVGCSRPSVVSGIPSVDNVLNALETASTQTYESGLFSFGGESEDGTARKCVKITYPSGGTGKYCGPNVDTIVANCGSRGWKCEETSSTQDSALLDLAVRDDPERVTCLVNVAENATTTIGSASVSTFNDLDCTFASQAGEDACLTFASDCGCNGCTSNDEGDGQGSVMCPECVNIDQCLD